MVKRKKNIEQISTAQRLSGIIKAARDIMRKDKGLSSDVDRLPMLTWIMFLKFFDDAEKISEIDAKIKGMNYASAIEPPYRWRDWAAYEEGITGSELISFINNDEAVRPDGSKGLGLFAYLRSLQGIDGGDKRDIIASVFRETFNRMTVGYLLRDVINKVNAINFSSSDEIHTLSFFYENMLREMRDAAGDAGEFYTPRPVIQLMVKVINPRIGETILDPACGTCGFLVDSFEHLKLQCKTTNDYNILQKKSIYGGEAKQLPYLLGQMNMLLHGIDFPQIDYGNSLRFPLREISDKDRVDVVLTNPPFGGEEERGILSNFPADKQTSETALLFLQLIMRKLRRSIGGNKGGRCGMVVPDGILFGDGVCARIKEELLKEFNLHTIVRLPNGVFAPYTGINTNLLFFERNGPTEIIWYYEHPLPPNRQKLKNPCYTKSNPLRYNEFEPLLDWWNDRIENEHSWKVNVNDVLEYNDEGNIIAVNLDVKNPTKENLIRYEHPEKLINDILKNENNVMEVMNEINDLLKNRGL